MSASGLYLAFDVGAASGVKFAVFGDSHVPRAPQETCAHGYHGEFDDFAGDLVNGGDSMLSALGFGHRDLAGVGIASAGILDSHGAFKLFHNRPRYNGHNLKAAMEKAFGVPAAIANDADAGGLAEWSVLGLELIYWVFGGGWGGSWISAGGDIRFPSTDWDGRDESLHFSNEPGYAIALDLWSLKGLQRMLGRMGFLNYMRPSVLDERGSNANLVGAAELARRAAARR